MGTETGFNSKQSLVPTKLWLSVLPILSKFCSEFSPPSDAGPPTLQHEKKSPRNLQGNANS